ncbi:lipid-A-disaccharide synthase, partial [Salmonella enterica subsp. enterica serovar Chester]|nr:lipid-A-disaccharide synthase [Salmonella enterica subsp. enterica serovar Chester]
ANALLPLLQGGEAVDKLRETFLELHQKIRLDADNQAAQAVSDIASN